MKMQEIGKLKQKMQYVFTDIDDTLTTKGFLKANSYQSLWKLYKQGIKIVPITGRPAGWCEMIARFWPVEAVIGENGAFYFSYNREEKKMQRFFSQQESERQENKKKLEDLKDEVLKQVPGAALASDQFCRLIDVAIDFCEDVKPLKKDDINKIVDIFHKGGAQAKVSSIHVNAWFGEHDKLSMCKSFCKQKWQKDLQDILDQAVFCGDSPNDEPMFSYFKYSVGVANVKDFQEDMKSLPKYICSKNGADGFEEMVSQLLK